MSGASPGMVVICIAWLDAWSWTWKWLVLRRWLWKMNVHVLEHTLYPNFCICGALPSQASASGCCVITWVYWAHPCWPVDGGAWVFQLGPLLVLYDVTEYNMLPGARWKCLFSYWPEPNRCDMYCAVITGKTSWRWHSLTFVSGPEALRQWV